MPAVLSSGGVGTVAAALAEGRRMLFEHESLNIVQTLGIAVPAHVMLRGPDELASLDLGQFSGDSLVLKIVSPTILHKSDVGGVRVVARERMALEAAVEQMAARTAELDVVGFLIEEFIPHDRGLGDELLLGLRKTRDFGPVVTLGSGGVYAEYVAEAFTAGREVAIISPEQATDADVLRALARLAVTPLITGQLRGQGSPVPLGDLTAVVGRMIEFASSPGAEGIDELEINPLVLGSTGPVALDAVIRLGSRPPVEEPRRPLENLDRLLKPQSIAVIGASQGLNPGRIILRNILAAGFDRKRVIVVKPGCRSLDGCRCVPSLAELPDVDLLVVSVRAHQVPEIVQEVTRGDRVPAMILVSGGLGEAGDPGGWGGLTTKALHAARAAGRPGPLINGGNCLGIRSVPGRYNTLFIPAPKLQFPPGPADGVALLSQSGAFAVARSSKLWSLNPRYVITVGNQIDLTFGDYLTHLENDLEIDLFACYIEGFRPGDGSRWLRAARRIVASGRDVVLYRGGRTATGGAAAMSHSASIAGDYVVLRQLAEAAGVVVAESFEEFEDLVRLSALLRRKRIEGMRLGAISNAGFECVAIADSLGPLELAELASGTLDGLAAGLEEHGLSGVVQPRNPLDVTPTMNDAGFEWAVRSVLDDPGVDLGVVGCVPLSAAITTLSAGEGHKEDARSPASVASRLARLFSESSKAWVAVVDAGPKYQSMVEVLEAAGVPTFASADRAMRALARYAGGRVTRQRGSRGRAER